MTSRTVMIVDDVAVLIAVVLSLPFPLFPFVYVIPFSLSFLRTNKIFSAKSNGVLWIVWPSFLFLTRLVRLEQNNSVSNLENFSDSDSLITVKIEGRVRKVQYKLFRCLFSMSSIACQVWEFYKVRCLNFSFLCSHSVNEISSLLPASTHSQQKKGETTT